jgi:hypothetical protein
LLKFGRGVFDNIHLAWIWISAYCTVGSDIGAKEVADGLADVIRRYQTAKRICKFVKAASAFIPTSLYWINARQRK